MARYSAGALTSAGSATLPVFSLYGGTTTRPKIREIGLFNTTATAVQLKLSRLTTTGTQGAALTETGLIPEDPIAIAQAFNTHTVAPTLGVDLGYRCVLGGAVGAGVIWTFPDYGLGIPAVAAAGVGVIVSSGTGQICTVYLVWDE